MFAVCVRNVRTTKSTTRIISSGVLTHLPRKKTSAISAAAAGGIISYMTGVIPLRKEGCSDEPLFREYENSEIRHPSLA